VALAPSNEALRRPPHGAPPAAAAGRRMERGARQATRSAAGSSGRAGRNLRGILASQTTIPAPSQCTRSCLLCDQRPAADPRSRAAFSSLSRPQCAVLL